MRNKSPDFLKKLREEVERVKWYHTIDLGNNIITPGIYDLRPLLHHFGIPEDLTGKTVLDIGTGSGFFAFEFERRGASRIVATDLPRWTGHDFTPLRRTELSDKEFESYLKEPFLIAKKALHSRVKRKEINIYDISPRKIGKFDLVFCGSLLLHLTDPIKALFNIRMITKGLAIIATAIDPTPSDEPRALFVGHPDETTWWFPNLNCLVKMAECAGFGQVEVVSTFDLESLDGRFNTPHGVIKSWVDRSYFDHRPSLSPWWALPGKTWCTLRQEGVRSVISKAKTYLLWRLREMK